MAGFRKATKQRKNLVISFQGASGAGKTYSALNVANHLCPAGKRIAFIDTENSAELYADTFDFDVDDDFGPFGKLNYGPQEWMKKLRAASESKQYGVVVLDSLTHMWKGPGGILWMLDADAAAYKAKTGKFADTNALWKKYTPIYEGFMNDLRHLGMHVIFCLRSKEKTDRKTNAATNKTEITKLGLEPEFREGFAYDVDAQMLLDEDHIMVAKKHRLQEYLYGKVFENPGKNLADQLQAFLASGIDLDERAVPTGAETSIPIAQTPSVAKAFPPPPAVEEPAPITDPQPAPPDEAGPEPVTEQASDALFESLKAAIAKAANKDDLKNVGTRITTARKEKQINKEQYDALNAAFTARAKALKEAA